MVTHVCFVVSHATFIDFHTHPLENSRWEETINKEDRLTHASALECTLWEDANKPSSFNFIAGNIKVDKVYESGKDYLESPTFMTHLRRHKAVMVSETLRNRIGLYDEDTFALKGWFPSFKSDLAKPMHLLALSCGSVAVIEAFKGISIYSFNGTNYERKFLIKGLFRGLDETEDQDLVSLEHAEDKYFVRIFKREEGSDRYEVGDSVQLNLDTNSMTGMEPLPRYLVYYKGKVYISDFGAAKIYVLNIANGEQLNIGCYGKSKDHLINPLPILIDDQGNILVADNSKGRLQVFDANGMYVKRVSYKCQLNKGTYGFLRMGNMFYLSFWCTEQGKSGLVRFEIKSEDDGFENIRISSPLDVLM